MVNSQITGHGIAYEKNNILKSMASPLHGSLYLKPSKCHVQRKHVSMCSGNCVQIVYSISSHWRCLFPYQTPGHLQPRSCHGSGRAHSRESHVLLEARENPTLRWVWGLEQLPAPEAYGQRVGPQPEHNSINIYSIA